MCRHHLHPLHRPRLGRIDALVDADRARRAGRRELHEAQLLVDAVVVAGVEPRAT
jgi:hypothetical protein